MWGVVLDEVLVAASCSLGPFGIVSGVSEATQVRGSPTCVPAPASEEQPEELLAELPPWLMVVSK